jgi:hypothetical protein
MPSACNAPTWRCSTWISNTRTITCNLVEVKCYSQVGDFAAFNQLKERISAQINQSERILQRHFDPALKKPDRPDRLLKSREFAQILRFYLERSLRYGIFDTGAAGKRAVCFNPSKRATRFSSGVAP